MLQRKLSWVFLTLVLLHLVPVLPDGEWLWKINDSVRALSFAVIATCMISLVPWRALKEKCLVAAIAGYGWADFLSCLLWYGLDLDWFWLSTILQAGGFLYFFSLYWWRSYKQPSAHIMDDNVYVLRRYPRSLQDFLIALLPTTAPYGGYAICVEKSVFMFRHGVLVCLDAADVPLERYHVVRGKEGKKSDFEDLLGVRWELWGYNCMSVLRDYWNTHK